MPAPNGAIMPMLAANKDFMQEVFERVFEDVGGEARLAEFAATNDANYLEFMKLVVRTRPKQNNVTVNASLEVLIEQLDKMPAQVAQVQNAPLETIDAEFSPLPLTKPQE